MGSLSEVRSLLEQAATFERAGDIPEAVARARVALRVATDPESHDEARLALERLEVCERGWRAATEARRAAFLERERGADAYVANVRPDAPRNEEHAPASRWRRLLSRRQRQSSAAFAR